MLFFIINISQSFSAAIKSKINNQPLTTQINQHAGNHLSTDYKNHLSLSVVKDQIDKMKLRNVTEESNASSWSDAFNFQKVAGTQIDPRTGTFIAYIKTGSLISNLDHGPNINLQVNYNSNSMANPDGLGRGWSWNLTHFNPVNNQLITSQGKSFSLQQDDTRHWQPRYHKIKDMQIDGDKKTHFFITYINGLREILNHDGYEVRLEQQDGKGVNFSYLHGTHLLSMICDDQGKRIILTRKNNYLTVTSYNSNGKPVNIRINQAGNELQSITLSSEKHKHKYKHKHKRKHKNEQGIYMHYSLVGHLLTRFIYPTGLTKSIHYDCHEAMKMPLYSNQWHGLCVVTSQVVDPGSAQPKIVTRYAYNQINSNEHNYLGFNAGLNILPGTQKDFLFEAPANYTYRTSEDNGLLQIVRTYNKYHLLIDTKLFSDKTQHLLAETHDFFCHTDQYNGCTHTNFEDLPVTYTLPLKMETHTWGESSGLPAIDVTLQSYDNNGRIVDETDAYGRRETIKYCPVKGDAFCPVAPSGWSLNALTESVIRYPSDKVAGASALPVVKVYRYYQKEPNINGNGYILVLHRQIAQFGHQWDTTIRHYYNNPGDYATYGLLQKLILISKTELGEKPEKLTRQYHYIIDAKKTTKTSYSIFEEGSSHARSSPSVTVSLFTHQILKVTDVFGKNITRYHYDNQERMIQADSATGTSFAVSKYYHYTVSPQLNQLIISSVNGLQQKIVFDAAGRKLESFSEMIDAHGKKQHNRWQRINSTTYDANGRLVATHSYDYRNHSSKQPKQLTITYDYTVTGRIFRKHMPDGETIINSYDDPDRCMVSYKLNKKGDHSVVTVVSGNVLDKPIRQILLPGSSGLPLSAKQYCTTGGKLDGAKITTVTYDADGRKISSTDPAGKTVITHYDDRGRVNEIIDPVGDTIHKVYNFTGKVIRKWVKPAKDDHQYLLFSAQYNMAGELVWQAGEDGKRTTYTYTSDGKPDTITTPAGDTITYKYNILRLPVNEWLNNKLLLQIHYNPLTAQPDKITDNTGIRTWIYSDDGKINRLTHHAINNTSADYKMAWTYDENRNVIAMTNPSGQQTRVTYDQFGRISSVSYQMNNGKEQLLSAPEYDGFSRIITVKYGSGMKRTIEYNNYGQKKSIADIFLDKLLSSWQYHYDNEGNIITLIRSENNHQQAVLNYRYDTLNNLISVNCTGSAGLPLCPRDTHYKGSSLNEAPVIIRQDYTFNALNRMTQVKEILTDTIQQKTFSKVVNYSYGDIQAPLRLQQMSTVWNGQPAVVNHFSYDIAGNMTTDGEGHHMTYNAFNQVAQVVTPNGSKSQYVYDGSGREVKQIANISDIRYMFYTGKNLVGEQINDLQQNKHTITHLGVAKAIDGVIHEYYEQNYKKDITAVLTKSHHSNNEWTVSQHTVYSPYGMRWHHTNTSQPFYLQTLTGFDGEQHDPVTGWQFLGAGHRTYNPQGRYFISEDPAGDGYSFGGNNPIMHTDPDGNMPGWIGSVMQIMDYTSTLGMAALHKKWANAVGIGLMVTLSTIITGIGLVLGGVKPLVSAGILGLSVATGSMMVTAAAVPVNRGLNIINAVVGITQIAVAVASAGLIFANYTQAFTKWLSQLNNGLAFSVNCSQTSVLEEEEVVKALAAVPRSVVSAGTESVGALTAEPKGVCKLSTIETMMKLFSDNIRGEDSTQTMFSIKNPDQFANILHGVLQNFRSVSMHISNMIFTAFTCIAQIKKEVDLNELSEFLEFASFNEFKAMRAFKKIFVGISASPFSLEDMQIEGYGLVIDESNMLSGSLVRNIYITHNSDDSTWSAVYVNRFYNFILSFDDVEEQFTIIKYGPAESLNGILSSIAVGEENIFGYR